MGFFKGLHPAGFEYTEELSSYPGCYIRGHDFSGEPCTQAMPASIMVGADKGLLLSKSLALEGHMAS